MLPIVISLALIHAGASILIRADVGNDAGLEKCQVFTSFTDPFCFWDWYFGSTAYGEAAKTKKAENLPFPPQRTPAAAAAAAAADKVAMDAKWAKVIADEAAADKLVADANWAKVIADEASAYKIGADAEAAADKHAKLAQAAADAKAAADEATAYQIGADAEAAADITAEQAKATANKVAADAKAAAARADESQAPDAKAAADKTAKQAKATAKQIGVDAKATADKVAADAKAKVAADAKAAADELENDAKAEAKAAAEKSAAVAKEEQTWKLGHTKKKKEEMCEMWLFDDKKQHAEETAKFTERNGGADLNIFNECGLVTSADECRTCAEKGDQNTLITSKTWFLTDGSEAERVPLWTKFNEEQDVQIQDEDECRKHVLRKCCHKHAQSSLKNECLDEISKGIKPKEETQESKARDKKNSDDWLKQQGKNKCKGVHNFEECRVVGPQGFNVVGWGGSTGSNDDEMVCTRFGLRGCNRVFQVLILQGVVNPCDAAIGQTQLCDATPMCVADEFDTGIARMAGVNLPQLCKECTQGLKEQAKSWKGSGSKSLTLAEDSSFCPCLCPDPEYFGFESKKRPCPVQLNGNKCDSTCECIRADDPDAERQRKSQESINAVGPPQFEGWD